MKKLIAIMTLVAVMSLGVASLGICSPDSWYYSNHTTTVEQLITTWGKPVRVVPMDNGTDTYIYKTHDNFAHCRYFIVKDGLVIDGGLGINRQLYLAPRGLPRGASTLSDLHLVKQIVRPGWSKSARAGRISIHDLP